MSKRYHGRELMIDYVADVLQDNGFDFGPVSGIYKDYSYFYLNKSLYKGYRWRTMMFYDDRVHVHRKDVCDERFEYANPNFPQNLLDYLNKTKKGKDARKCT